MMRSIQLVRSLSFLLFPKSERPAYELHENAVSRPKRIERHPALRQVSRSHHHGLLLCWKIRTGLSRRVDLERIEKYVNWYFENHLIAHIAHVEKEILPLLGRHHRLVEKSIIAHKRLRDLFCSSDDSIKKLYLIEKELEYHIRNTELELLNELQSIATSEQLKVIAASHPGRKFIENETDMFWK